MSFPSDPNAPQQPYAPQDPFAQQQYAPQQPYAPQTPPVAAPNTLGLVALIVAGVGAIAGCVPGIFGIGWFLLFAGFVLGIIAVVLRGKKKLFGFLAIGVSVVGTIIAVIVFTVSVIGTVTTAIEEQAGVVAEAAQEAEDALTPADPSDAQILDYGTTATFDSGLEITVGAPTEFTPSEYSSASGTGTPVTFEVTLVNGTDAPVDPSLVYMTVAADGTEGDFLIDSENGVVGAPTTSLLPGAKATYLVGYELASMTNVVSEITPDLMDFTVNPVFFTN